MAKNKQLPITLTQELREYVENSAKKKGTSASAFVSELILKHKLLEEQINMAKMLTDFSEKYGKTML